jgi:peptidoglycan/xylan/chitin deacetylase (PgdA/CDA1 family)
MNGAVVGQDPEDQRSPRSRGVLASGFPLSLERRSRSTWVAVLFHHVTDSERWRRDDPLTAGLGVDVSAETFIDILEILHNRYDVCPLGDVLDGRPPRSERKQLVICFDDAYASVAQTAAPLLAEMALPWTFFVNSGLVGSSMVAVDNIVAYIVNTVGLEPLIVSAGRKIRSIADYIGNHLATIPPAERRQIVEQVAASCGIRLADLAARRPYITRQELISLARSGVTIGNHTADHVHCRTLDDAGAGEQVADARRDLEDLAGTTVDSFAYPYGSCTDATPLMTNALKSSGHRCAFLVERRLNRVGSSSPFHLCRIPLFSARRAVLTLELEVLPRLSAAVAMLRTGAR